MGRLPGSGNHLVDYNDWIERQEEKRRIEDDEEEEDEEQD
jgi:hypothetical protein